MPRPIGYRLPQESKDKIGAGNRRAAASRSILSNTIKAIVTAASTGDTETAFRMIEDFSQILFEQREAQRTRNPELFRSAAGNAAVLAVFDQTMSSIDEETAERIRQELTEFVRESKNMYPYAGIPGPAERAAARRAVSNRMTSHTHEPLTGKHTHEHTSYDGTGAHRHEHEHFGDADHDHHD